MEAPESDALAALRAAAWSGEDPLAPGRLFDALVAAPEHLTRDDVDRFRELLVDRKLWVRAIAATQGGQGYKLAALYHARALRRAGR